MLPLREKRTDLNNSSSIKIITFFSFIINEAFREPFRLVLIQNAFNLIWVFLQNLATSSPLLAKSAAVAQKLCSVCKTLSGKGSSSLISNAPNRQN